ncbi:hypothetical protein G6F66_014559 [Rhizopus arrhizus]|nr:hypothetical protein G6F66_014559 [Rhizopus arrhizus]
MVVEVASKSPSSAEPGRSSRNWSRDSAICLASTLPSWVASSAASLRPARAATSVRRRCCRRCSAHTRQCCRSARRGCRSPAPGRCRALRRSTAPCRSRTGTAHTS